MTISDRKSLAEIFDGGRAKDEALLLAKALEKLDSWEANLKANKQQQIDNGYADAVVSQTAGQLSMLGECRKLLTEIFGERA